MGEEHRRYSRIDFDTSVYVCHLDRRIQAHVLDISMNGILVEFDHPVSFQMSDSVTLEIQLHNSTVVLKIDSTLVHIQEGRIGFKFKAIDIESFTHLKRILELNLGKSELYENFF